MGFVGCYLTVFCTANSLISRHGPITHSSARKCVIILTRTIAEVSWSRFISLPFLARDPKAVEVVQIILESVLLRRTKDMRDTDGKKIVELPPKEV